jgi:hypothetical protein
MQARKRLPHLCFRLEKSLRDGLEVLPFPVKIDVTENTARLFPELREAEPRLHRGLRKRLIDLLLD